MGIDGTGGFTVQVVRPGKDDAWKTIIDTDDRDEAEAEWSKALAKYGEAAELVMFAPDGELLHKRGVIQK